jgi:hypothetical protein
MFQDSDEAMATMVNALFVRFESAPPEGFQADFDYPVFCVDVISDEETRFLIANRAGQFRWVDMNEVRRASNRPGGSGGGGGGVGAPQSLAHSKTPPQFRNPAR